MILFGSGRRLESCVGFRRRCVPGNRARSASASELADVRPFFLPDGKHFLYYRSWANKEDQGVYVGSLDAKPSEQATKAFDRHARRAMYVASAAGGGNLFFLRGEALMAQPFDLSRLEFTGRAVQLADHVSTNIYDRFVFGFEHRPAGLCRHRRQQSAIDLVRPRGKGLGPRRRAHPRATKLRSRRTEREWWKAASTIMERGPCGCWIWRAAPIRASVSRAAAVAAPGRPMAARLSLRRAAVNLRTCIANPPTARARENCCCIPTRSSRPTTGRATAASCCSCSAVKPPARIYGCSRWTETASPRRI